MQENTKKPLFFIPHLDNQRFGSQIKISDNINKQHDEQADTLIFSKNCSVSQVATIKSKKPQKWSENDTNWFYTCLEMFGQDFAMIKKILSHKSLRQILRKFHKEKKRNPQKVEHILRIHESNKISFCPKTSASVVEHLLNQSSDSEKISIDLSDDQLEDVQNGEEIILEDCWSQKSNVDLEFEIKPLDYYLSNDFF